MAPEFPGSDASSRFVYVPVPEDRVEEVMQFLAGANDPNPADQPHPFGPTLEELVARVYRESEGPFRKLLRFLADHPGIPLSTGYLHARAGLPEGRGMSGMLGAFGRRSKHRYEGWWPFQKGRNAVSGDTELTMNASVADIIRSFPESWDWE